MGEGSPRILCGAGDQGLLLLPARAINTGAMWCSGSDLSHVIIDHNDFDIVLNLTPFN